MRPNEPALFTATAIPAGVIALTVTGWLAWTYQAELAPSWIPLALTIVFAVLSYHLSFSSADPGQLSLELAYFIAAALSLPFPAPLIVGAATGVIGSLLKVQRGLGATRFVTVTAANV